MAPRRKRNTKGAAIAQAILEQYQPQTKEDMQDAIKDIFGPMFEAMLQGEMNAHLGYESNDHGYKETDNRRNCYIAKNVKTSYGEIPVEVPRDRQATFEPQVIPKRTRDISGIEDKVISMYARGMIQRMYEYYVRHPEALPEDFQPQLSFDGMERTVCDYIAGMTDNYAVDKYTELFIPSGWQVRG